MNDFLENSKQEILEGMSNKSLFDTGNSDNYNQNGSSIWDDNANPLLGAGQSNMGQGMNTNTGEQTQYVTGEPFFEAILLFIIKLCKIVFLGLMSLIELPLALGKNTADTLFNMFRNMVFMFIGFLLVFAALFYYGYYIDSNITYVGFIGLVGCILDIVISGIGLGTVYGISYKPDNKKTLEAFIEKDKLNEANLTTEELNQEVEKVENLSNEYTESFDDIINSILGEEENTSEEIAPVEENNTNNSFDFSSLNLDEEPQEEPKQGINTEIDTTGVATLNSQTLFKMFAPLFPPINKNFAKTTEWTYENEYSDKWSDLFAIICNIFADAFGIDLQEVSATKENGGKGIRLNVVKDAQMFTYCEVTKPPKKQVKSDVIEDIFNNYSTDLINTICDKNQLYDNPANNKISSKVWMDGPVYKIILTKPNKNPIMLGDLLLKEQVQDKLSSGKNTPIVLGVDDLGEPIIKEFTNKSAPLYSGLIGGGAGSGKSWFFISLIIQFCAFYLPSDIQIINVDPKPDTVFNELDLLPHCAKLIQVDLNDPDKLAIDTLDMLEKLTKIEVARRGALFKEEKCSNLQDYRKKGHKDLPYILVFIDEYIKLREAIATYSDHKYEQDMQEWQDECANLEKGQPKPPKPQKVDQLKRLDAIMKVLTTTGRAPGIYVYIISHRFTGNVDIQTRNLTPLKLVLKSNKLLTETMEAEDVKNFSKKLINAGDAAIKVGEEDVVSGKTLGVCLDDSDTYEIIRTIAKTLYKVGFDLPDMSVLGKDFVKDFKAIKAELYKKKEDSTAKSIRFDEEEDPIEEEHIIDSEQIVEQEDLNEDDTELDEYKDLQEELDKEDEEEELNSNDLEEEQEDFKPESELKNFEENIEDNELENSEDIKLEDNIPSPLKNSEEQEQIENIEDTNSNTEDIEIKESKKKSKKEDIIAEKEFKTHKKNKTLKEPDQEEKSKEKQVKTKEFKTTKKPKADKEESLEQITSIDPDGTIHTINDDNNESDLLNLDEI